MAKGTTREIYGKQDRIVGTCLLSSLAVKKKTNGREIDISKLGAGWWNGQIAGTIDFDG